MGQGPKIILTCDIAFLIRYVKFGENKRHGHVTLAFLKINIRHCGHPIKGPLGGKGSSGTLGGGVRVRVVVGGGGSSRYWAGGVGGV